MIRMFSNSLAQYFLAAINLLGTSKGRDSGDKGAAYTEFYDALQQDLEVSLLNRNQ